MPDDTIRESGSIQRTKTALVFELRDGRRIELTAHVRSSRDAGLREMTPVDPEGETSTTQRGFQAGPALLNLRDLDAEDDDPIGQVPVSAEETEELAVDGPPEGWTRMDDDAVDSRIGFSPGYAGPCYEHDSVEAWLLTYSLFEDGMPQYQVVLEAGNPEVGIWPDADASTPNATMARRKARTLMQDYDHPDGEEDG